MNSEKTDSSKVQNNSDESGSSESKQKVSPTRRKASNKSRIMIFDKKE